MRNFTSYLQHHQDSPDPTRIDPVTTINRIERLEKCFEQAFICGDWCFTFKWFGNFFKDHRRVSVANLNLGGFLELLNFLNHLQFRFLSSCNRSQRQSADFLELSFHPNVIHNDVRQVSGVNRHRGESFDQRVSLVVHAAADDDGSAEEEKHIADVVPCRDFEGPNENHDAGDESGDEASRSNQFRVHQHSISAAVGQWREDIRRTVSKCEERYTSQILAHLQHLGYGGENGTEAKSCSEMINDARWNLWKVLQFISSRGEDGKQIKAQDADEQNSEDVNNFTVCSDGAVDEIQIIKIMNSSTTLRSLHNEIASFLIRQRWDVRTRRLIDERGENYLDVLLLTRLRLTTGWVTLE